MTKSYFILSGYLDKSDSQNNKIKDRIHNTGAKHVSIVLYTVQYSYTAADEFVLSLTSCCFSFFLFNEPHGMPEKH